MIYGVIFTLVSILAFSGCGQGSGELFRPCRKMKNGGGVMNSGQSDYSAFDRPEILLFLFHPRKEDPGETISENAVELKIPINGDINIGGRLYISGKASMNILFFHGNGEIVADYDDLAPLFNKIGVNFIPVDYRGYGKSNGIPTVSNMMKDSHNVFQYVSSYLKSTGYTGKIIVMGRSLGSASALELASSYPKLISGLIIESGFAYAVPLLRFLGADPDALGITEEKGFRNIDKIKKYDKPTLVIHAERDHIIPFSDGRALYDASGSKEKWFIKIPEANHNTIFYHGLNEYMTSVKRLVSILEQKYNNKK